MDCGGWGSEFAGVVSDWKRCGAAKITVETRRAQRKAKELTQTAQRKTENTEKAGEHSQEWLCRRHREGQRRDGDARSVVLRLSRYPSHEAKARRMGHPSLQN